MLSIIIINESEKWDAIVKSFCNYDVYYLSGYVKAFQIHGDGQPILFYFENNCMRAINIVMQRDIENDRNFTTLIPSQTYFDLVTPYGYGGFLIEGDITVENIKQLDIDFSTYCNNRGIVSEFVRFHPILNNAEKLNSMYNISTLGKTVSIKLNSREEIWNNLTSKNRNMVRKAQKNSINIYWGRDQELYSEFVELYNSTMKRDNAKEYYYFCNDFYRSILYDLNYNSMIFYAVYIDKIIAMSIILFSNKRMHYHLSASNKEYQHLAPSNLLLYEAACWGCENGYEMFHLGGGIGNKEDNLYRFKKAFNRYSDNSFKIGQKVFDYKKYEHLIKLKAEKAESIINVDYFPQYRG